MLGECGPRHRNSLVELCLQTRKTLARQFKRIEVRFEIEECQLGREVVWLQLIQHRFSHTRRTPLLIDQEHLLFGADAGDPGFDQAAIDHAFQCAEVLEEVARERSNRFGPEVGFDVPAHVDRVGAA